MTNTITYSVKSDLDNKLRDGAKLACNFWNHHIGPSKNIVMRLETFINVLSQTVASAYKPWTKESVLYGRVAFNTKYLKDYTILKAAGTIAHELGHVLGFGWEEWMALVDTKSGLFTADAMKKLPALLSMSIETDYGNGTKWSHWDEDKFDLDLMSPFKDDAEIVLPVTIDVVGLLGHTVHTTLSAQGDLDTLLQQASQPTSEQKSLWTNIDLDHFQETPIFETLTQPTTS